VVELASAFGIVALSLLALQLVLPARVRLVARPLGADVAVRLHRHLADVLVAAIAAHVALVVASDPSSLALLDPLGAPWRAKAALASCAALAALVASSVLRRRLRLAYASWRGLHVALGAGALGLSVIHAIGVDRYLTPRPACWWRRRRRWACWPCSSYGFCDRGGSPADPTCSNEWYRSAVAPPRWRCAPRGTAGDRSGRASSPG